jgi:hypothetical protein
MLWATVAFLAATHPWTSAWALSLSWPIVVGSLVGAGLLTAVFLFAHYIVKVRKEMESRTDQVIATLKKDLGRIFSMHWDLPFAHMNLYGHNIGLNQVCKDAKLNRKKLIELVETFQFACTYVLQPHKRRVASTLPSGMFENMCDDSDNVPPDVTCENTLVAPLREVYLTLAPIGCRFTD